jgi:hypothetical protein
MVSDGTVWQQEALAAAAEVYGPVVRAGGNPSLDAPSRIALEAFMAAHRGADVNAAHRAIIAAAEAVNEAAAA